MRELANAAGVRNMPCDRHFLVRTVLLCDSSVHSVKTCRRQQTTPAGHFSVAQVKFRVPEEIFRASSNAAHGVGRSCELPWPHDPNRVSGTAMADHKAIGHYVLRKDERIFELQWG